MLVAGKEVTKKEAAQLRRTAAKHKRAGVLAGARCYIGAHLDVAEEEHGLTIVEMLQLLLEFQKSWLSCLNEQGKRGKENGGK